MQIPYERWYEAIFNRRSRRQYSMTLPESEKMEAIKGACEAFRPFDGARAVFVNQSPEKVFKGALGHYGKIKNAPAFIAFIGSKGDPLAQEKVGFTGEGIILEATALGLATCWVGGFFRPEIASQLASVREDEILPAVTPIGMATSQWTMEEKIMSGFGRSHRRKTLDQMVEGVPEGQWPAWVKNALNAARLAPSAVNRQPWHFKVEAGSIAISADSLMDTYNISRRLDCGIAMLHLEVAALNSGVQGKWEFMEPPGVARFLVNNPVL